MRTADAGRALRRKVCQEGRGSGSHRRADGRPRHADIPRREVLYDSGGQSGYYLDQPDVIRAISAGAGEEISFTGRLAQMQVAVSVRQGDSILRLTKSQTVFRNGDWGLFAALMCILLVVAIYISFVMARRIVTPISQLSQRGTVHH